MIRRDLLLYGMRCVLNSSSVLSRCRGLGHVDLVFYGRWELGQGFGYIGKEALFSCLIKVCLLYCTSAFQIRERARRRLWYR